MWRTFVGINFNHAQDITVPVLKFLGIQPDTILRQARLPDDKLQEAKDRVKSAILNTLLSREGFDSLIGLLTYVFAILVVPVRAFFRRLFNKISRARGFFVLVNQEIKADLLWWHPFLKKWNSIRSFNSVCLANDITFNLGFNSTSDVHIQPTELPTLYIYTTGCA